MTCTNPTGPQHTRAPQFFLDDPSHATRQDLSKSLLEYGNTLIALAVLAMLEAKGDSSANDGGQFDNPWQRLDQLLQHLVAQPLGDSNGHAATPFDYPTDGGSPGSDVPPPAP